MDDRIRRLISRSVRAAYWVCAILWLEGCRYARSAAGVEMTGGHCYDATLRFWGVGLIGGLAVSTFSRTLTFLIGLLVFGVQVWPSLDR